MRVAIVHYHLKPGGVTRVIENAVMALGEGMDVVVISGETYADEVLHNTAVVPDLRYTGKDEKPDVDALVKKLCQVAHRALGGAPDVWHIHNHALGKNSAMPEVVMTLAEKGAALLLQMHDFAEDGRPGNFAYIHRHLKPDVPLYPFSERIHYAGLNGRDVGFLGEMGVPQTHLHLLPNPVMPFAQATSRGAMDELACERLWLYPTRAIRRKNMGEFILAAASAEEGELFASTLAPANPAALPVYQRWVSFAQTFALQARFGIGHTLDCSFGEIIAAADAVVTTSVAEGFGLAFLEPWLMHKPLLGRNLTAITADFEQHGVQLGSLYTTLTVPLELVEMQALQRTLEKELQQTYQQYRRPMPKDAVQHALNAMLPEPDLIDFGRLNEPLQETVIAKVLASQALQAVVRRQFFRQPVAQATIVHNCRIIADIYSLPAYGIRLREVYANLAARAPGPIAALDGDRLLNCFLAPARFCLLRS